MLDFHTHILPGMDDGSKDIFMSLAMVEASTSYGCDILAATPHFYAGENSPLQFLERREAAYNILINEMKLRGNGTRPKILLGAEVLYYDGISIAEDLDLLCLEGTKFLLLEMPFTKWNPRMIREVAVLRRKGIMPVAAHVERYMDIQPKRLMADFLSLEIFIQCNADFFLSKRTARKALQMLEDGHVQFLGSDAHNATTCPPNLGPALELIRQKLGQEPLDHLGEYESLVLEGSGIFP